MATLTLKAIVQENGKIELNNLPFSVGKELEITISEEMKNENSSEEILARIEKIKKSSGTINSGVILTNEDLRRENMYGDDGR